MNRSAGRRLAELGWNSRVCGGIWINVYLGINTLSILARRAVHHGGFDMAGHSECVSIPCAAVEVIATIDDAARVSPFL
jgi:hypothetical protein